MHELVLEVDEDTRFLTEIYSTHLNNKIQTQMDIEGSLPFKLNFKVPYMDTRVLTKSFENRFLSTKEIITSSFLYAMMVTKYNIEFCEIDESSFGIELIWKGGNPDITVPRFNL